MHDVLLVFFFFSTEYGRRKRNAFRIQVAKGSSVSVVSTVPEFWLCFGCLANVFHLFLQCLE